MPRNKWIDKSTATTFALVHRPQNDPKIHDESSNSMVFQELTHSQAHKIQNRKALESRLFDSIDAQGTRQRVRDNEGEAAECGVFFDDTEYDYMQHIRELGSGATDGETYFVEAPVKRKAGKGKVRLPLEDALREASLEDDIVEGRSTAFWDEDVLPSKKLKENSYQNQQDVPDALAGFQPDMDPRLREVLEALEDDAYVDNEEEDFFGELANGGMEISLAEFKESELEEPQGEDDQGWETDDTAKPSRKYKTLEIAPALQDADVSMEDNSDHGDGSWMKEFHKFKRANQRTIDHPQTSNEIQSSVLTGTSIAGGRRKKRKGAMTSSSNYSMTSSSLLRSEGLTLLDARFDKVQEDYVEEELDDEGKSVSVISGILPSSSQALPLSSGFNNMMDEFLDGYSMSGKKRIKKGRYQTGIEQLDEIRNGLGPARIRT